MKVLSICPIGPHTAYDSEKAIDLVLPRSLEKPLQPVIPLDLRTTNLNVLVHQNQRDTSFSTVDGQRAFSRLDNECAGPSSIGVDNSNEVGATSPLKREAFEAVEGLLLTNKSETAPEVSSGMSYFILYSFTCLFLTDSSLYLEHPDAHLTEKPVTSQQTSCPGSIGKRIQNVKSDEKRAVHRRSLECHLGNTSHSGVKHANETGGTSPMKREAVEALEDFPISKKSGATPEVVLGIQLFLYCVVPI